MPPPRPPHPALQSPACAAVCGTAGAVRSPSHPCPKAAPCPRSPPALQPRHPPRSLPPLHHLCHLPKCQGFRAAPRPHRPNAELRDFYLLLLLLFLFSSSHRNTHGGAQSRSSACLKSVPRRGTAKRPHRQHLGAVRQFWGGTFPKPARARGRRFPATRAAFGDFTVKKILPRLSQRNANESKSSSFSSRTNKQKPQGLKFRVASK